MQIVLTNKRKDVMISISKKNSKRDSNEKGILIKKEIRCISYVGEIYQPEIKGRRLKPLDSVICKTQYVSGMAEKNSHRLSLNHRF